jgi:osmotically-inducible protein OsmY
LALGCVEGSLLGCALKSAQRNGFKVTREFAKNSLECNKAETIARGVKGVKSVKNEIAIRP